MREKDKYEYLMEIDHNYPFETLVNGNVTECINTLKDIFKIGLIKWGHEQLNMIKEDEYTKNRYEYILKKVQAVR